MSKTNNKRKSSKGKKLTDVPVGTMVTRTYNTVSCRLPRVTDEIVLRSQRNFVLTAQAAANTVGSYIFSLTDSQISTAFFDQYMIMGIRFTITPRSNALGLTAGLTDLYTVIDYDDGSVLSSQAAAETYNNCIKLAAGESCVRTFSPRVAVAAYTGSFTGFLNQPAQWIDSASANVQHYGLKVFIPPTGVVGQTVFQQWDTCTEYFIKFRNSF